MLLGIPADYPAEYAPEVLHSVPRADARKVLGIGQALPFHGTDIWNGWELSWIDSNGKPTVGTAHLTVDASSPNIVESKSPKLYLGSFAMTQYHGVAVIANVISTDLENLVGLPVKIEIYCGAEPTTSVLSTLPGDCVDNFPLKNADDSVNANALYADGKTVEGALNSHLLRSLCPVTNQPDIGSVLIRYKGPRIDPSSFLSYIVSFRKHHDFHESCIERMFIDIKRVCKTEKLTVHGFYNRRGGIDINPFRSDFENTPQQIRLWRQ